MSCTSGSGTRFATTVARSFRIIPQQEDGGSGGRTFQFETPTQFSGHQCPQTDQWGVYGYNDTWSASLGGACILVLSGMKINTVIQILTPGFSMSITTMVGATIQAIKDAWQDFLIRGEELQWQASEARKELAIERLSKLRAYMNQPYGGTLTNPYKDLDAL